MIIHEMTQKEIEAKIFEGAYLSAARGFSDVFTPEQLLEIENHPRFDDFDKGFQDWLWSAIDNLLE